MGGEGGVDLGKIGDIGDEDGGVDDEIEAAAARLEYGGEVEEDLAELGFEIGTGGLAGGGIDAGLAGDEEESGGADGLRIGADGLDGRDVDDLFQGHEKEDSAGGGSVRKGCWTAQPRATGYETLQV